MPESGSVFAASDWFAIFAGVEKESGVAQSRREKNCCCADTAAKVRGTEILVLVGRVPQPSSR